MSWDAKDRDGRAYTGNIHDPDGGRTRNTVDS